MKRLLLALALLLPIITYSQDFIINNFDVDVVVKTDGSLDVNEIIDVTFSKKKRGIYRAIPYRYKKEGKSTTLKISNANVTGHKSKITRKNGNLSIRIGDKDVYINGPQKYQINYTIENGIQSYDGYQELYYDLTGNDWKAEIEKLSYQIHLPKSLTLAKNSMLSTTGRRHETLPGLSISQNQSKIVSGETNRVLKEKEGASIAVRLPESYLSVADLAANDYVQEQQRKQKERESQNPWLALIPMGLFAGFIQFWRKIRFTGSDDKGQETYAYPPEGLTSAHVGAYIDQVANTRDIVSLIPYWAAEGFLTMKNINDDTQLTRVQNLDDNFPDYEHTVFRKLFEDGDTRLMSSLKDNFYRTLAKAKSKLTKEVKSQGYYDEGFIYWFRSWRLIFFPLFMVVAAVISFVILKQLVLGIFFIVLGLISLFFALGRLPLSEYGQEMKYKLDGLKKFLEDLPESEVPSLVEHDAKYFEKMLPFAVAFGLDKKFIPKFESTMEQMPYWYASTTDINSFQSFSSGFATEEISSAFSSSPAPSGGGGGSFSSGGGVGGGGGGSW